MKQLVYGNFLLFLFLLCVQCNTEAPPLSESTKNPVLLSFNGPDMCKVGQSYQFEAVGYDPDGEQILFHFSCWIGEFFEYYQVLESSGWIKNNNVFKKDITFKRAGGYTVCCHCTDVDGNESAHVQLGVAVND